MGKKVMKFQDVWFRYGEDLPWVLQDVSFEISASEWVAVIGHNGSGKSTIAKLMNGLLFPQKGKILINGLEVNEETIWDVRKQVGMVFQNPDNQFVGTTVRDDVAFGLENRGIPREEMIRRLKSSLAAVRMEDFELQEPHRLSGGQKQRVAIAGVLAVSPQVIILDEATAMLDPSGRKEIIETVKTVKEQDDVSLVTITHDLNEVTLADRVLVMNEGKVWMEAPPRSIFAKRDELKEIGLDIPFVTKLSAELTDRDVILDSEPLNHDELLEELWRFHLNR
ncbi:energy-coupling factor ABC transporter ATP-binding protein [Sediminibacillus dalangtanensis]|uniref:Energy-coupling factor ABC transporter ATP-binding protein n=1 Tax=Sediminibacillus dalangtanensis TaxID=2729421 RepID=A0ABX7VN99_9BACI|nr:energy-coupling factor ABC transporter ATP-binding protein [Sediminibacillus dalangtanensis]QTM97908.1 energy-coupling factor ABC transporter ATP-binding protein [Sediminibacillus dalangtanensis]